MGAGNPCAPACINLVNHGCESMRVIKQGLGWWLVLGCWSGWVHAQPSVSQPPSTQPAAPCQTSQSSTSARTDTSTFNAQAPSGRVGPTPADVPEAASGFRSGLQPVRASGFMVVTANPLASQVACEVLAAGGSAVDAAVAAQMVLGLVEPQSSGLGGGGFLLHFNARTGVLQSFDGRETAPMAASAQDLEVKLGSGQSLRDVFHQLRSRGTSIGTPGVLRMLEMAHRTHGRMAWSALLRPAQTLAEQGFVVSPRLAQAIAQARDDLRWDADAAAYFLNADLTPKTAGMRLRNPAYAQTLQAIVGGADAFYTGDMARDIVSKVRTPQGPRGAGLMTLDDLANYRAVQREPVCSVYRVYRVCGMGPPSAGALVISQALGILSAFDLPSMKPQGALPPAQAVHWVSEALRLAYADRNTYMADTDFVPLPAQGEASLLDPAYLAQRSALIQSRSMGKASAGDVGVGKPASSDSEGKGTTHLSIVDAQGNAVVMTSSIESSMGAFRFVRGFLLNNQLTDFAWLPEPGPPPANRIEPLKRPRSSMTPTLVFKQNPDGSRGELMMATGSPGGPAIMPYVLKTLVAVLDWGMDPQAAANLPNFGAFNTPATLVEGDHPALREQPVPAKALLDDLKERGHQINSGSQTSGVGIIVRDGAQWVGGADPRREGLVLGGP
jgi:gamma-glutamyltranspeptidase/glutathione hydrolase